MTAKTRAALLSGVDPELLSYPQVQFLASAMEAIRWFEDGVADEQKLVAQLKMCFDLYHSKLVTE